MAGFLSHHWLLRTVAIVVLVATVSHGAPKAESNVKIYTADETNDMVGEGTSIAISIMLIGSISFMMGLFYLVNSEDDDIKRYAWKVVSATISIFCAVLLFQAFNGIVEEYFIDGAYKMWGLEEESPPAKIWECVVDVLQLVFWLTMMQLVLAVFSGALAENLSEYVWQPEEIEEAEMYTKSYAVLFAHISGFAAINAWGSVQQNMLSYNPFTAILIVPLGLIGLFGIYAVYDMIREGIALGDDGEKDEFETAWDDEAEESENDVAGLSMSFLTAQVVRLLIGGTLPNEEGKEPHDIGYHHTPGHCKLLLAWGFIFLAGLIVVLKIRAHYPDSVEDVKSSGASKKQIEEAEEEYDKYSKVIRPLLIFNVYFACGMAWCWFYGTLWTVASMGWTDQDAMLQVIVAIIVSGVSFFIIWTFDKIEDAQILPDASKAIEAMIDALGILIGFSWEQSFDVAVDVISESVDKFIPKVFGRLIMSFLLTLIVFPAWKKYILPTELELKEESTIVGQTKKVYREKLEKQQHHFLENELPEGCLDHAHAVLKLHRRKHHDKTLQDVKSDKKLKHLILTAEGLIEVPKEGIDDKKLLEQLLPKHFREEEEEEEKESRWNILSRMKSVLSLTTLRGSSAAGSAEEKEEKEP